MSKELLLVAEAVSNEKGVDKEVVFSAIQAAIESATKKKYGMNVNIRVNLNTETGEYDTYRLWEVVGDDAVVDLEQQIPLTKALEKKEHAKLGDFIEEQLESVEFGRIAAQAAKQAIVQRVRKAERQLIVEQYKSKKGTLVTGIVKKTTRDYLLLDLSNSAEAILLRSEMLPQDIYRPGDRVRALLSVIDEEAKGPQLLLSRTKPGMLIELFKIEVPEIGEQVIEIKRAARDPGVRAKIAVKTNDGRIDPIGACVGMRGSRVQAVSGELGGERIDIVLWDDNPAQLVINAMAPAEVVSIVMDEDTSNMDIAVKEEQLSQAIGKNGQNVKLASDLTGWNLNVMSENDLANKSKEEADNVASLFVEKLNVEADIATLLAQHGFSSLEEIAYIPEDELLNIEGFDQEIVKELRDRANDILLTSALSSKQVWDKAKPTDSIKSIRGMEDDLANQLIEKGIVTINDLAEQSTDELLELVDISKDLAGKLIMQARESWEDN